MKIYIIIFLSIFFIIDKHSLADDRDDTICDINKFISLYLQIKDIEFSSMISIRDKVKKNTYLLYEIGFIPDIARLNTIINDTRFKDIDSHVKISAQSLLDKIVLYYRIIRPKFLYDQNFIAQTIGKDHDKSLYLPNDPFVKYYTMNEIKSIIKNRIIDEKNSEVTYLKKLIEKLKK